MFKKDADASCFSVWFKQSLGQLKIAHHVSLSIFVASIGGLFSSLVFVPHPIAILKIILISGSTCAGMIGSCIHYFQGRELSSLGIISCLLLLARIISLATWFCQCFMTVRGKSRSQRAMSSIKLISDNTLHGALFSAALGFVLLRSPCSMQVRFGGRMIAGGLLTPAHVMLFLPVLSSLLGPRRTVWPRIYVSQTNKGETTSGERDAPTSGDSPAKRSDSSEERKRITFRLPDDTNSICPIAELDDTLSQADTDVDEVAIGVQV